MVETKNNKKTRAEKYLDTIEEATNLFDALDYPPGYGLFY